MSNYEQQYMTALWNIYENGYEDGVNKRTGVATKRLPGIVLRVDVEKEFPILKSKKVFWKTALKEILWIWQKQSNNIKDLDAHIWDEWADEDGSIGTAYGYQIHKDVSVYKDPVHKTEESYRHYKSQADYVIEMLREDPTTRWAIATLWNPAELKDMNLVPCCHTSTWNLDGGRLNCVLDQRSGDMPYGVPFNTTQYAMLMCLIANDLGVKPGILTHVIADAHIYDRQMEGVKMQLLYWKAMNELGTLTEASVLNEVISMSETGGTSSAWSSVDSLRSHIEKVKDSNPKFVLSENVTGASFYDITIDDCMMDDYESMGVIKFGEIVQ